MRTYKIKMRCLVNNNNLTIKIQANSESEAIAIWEKDWNRFNVIEKITEVKSK